jgi:hypothetical protein
MAPATGVPKTPEARGNNETKVSCDQILEAEKGGHNGHQPGARSGRWTSFPAEPPDARVMIVATCLTGRLEGFRPSAGVSLR